MKRTLRCPSCLIEIDPEAVRVEDYEGNESTRPLWRPRTRRFWSAKNSVPDDGNIEDLQRGWRFTCGRGHTLPDDLLEVDIAPIALLGLSQSMKTHFVAALGYQLTREQRMAELSMDRQLVFTTLEEARERLDRQYINPLFGRKEVLVPTTPVLNPAEDEPVRDPVTLRATFRTGHIFAGPSIRKMYVSLYDAPGEMFRSRREQMVHAPYLVDPSGIILFLDVASLPRVRDELDASAPDNFSFIDPQIITSAAEAMQRFHGVREPMRVPLAVVVSRADLLEHSPAFARYHKVLGDDSLANRRGNELAREFVDTYAPGVPIFAEEAFDGPIQYFFASATGCSPEDGRFPRVEPWGCLAPLLWMLESIGFAR